MIRTCLPLRPPALALIGTAWLCPDSSLAQQLGQAAEGGVSLWRVVGALMFCLLLALGAAIVLKMRMKGGAAPPFFKHAVIQRLAAFKSPSRRLSHIQSLRVGQNVEICMFTCDDRQFLIAATPASLLLLQEGAAPSSDAP